MQREFDSEKSHMSAEARTEFLENAKPESKLTLIPGVGGVTANRLKNQGISTLSDLIRRTENSYTTLKELVGPVNSHRIFDALSSYQERAPVGLKSVEEGLNEAMGQIVLVDEKEDKKIAKDIENNTCILQ
jgi:nucleotidyltransferase/DNA polymerase involved in DNA repair